MDINKLTAAELSAGLRSREISVADSTRAYISAAKQSAHVGLVFEDEAMAAAVDMQKMIDSGAELPSLAGVPVGVCDNIFIKNKPASAGSNMLGGFTPPFESTAVSRLRDAGAIIVAQLKGDEFYADGHSGSCPAGAVAEGAVALAIGSDTCGSMRARADAAGIACLRPTYGAVSRFGLVAYVSSMDQISALGRTAEDCAACIEVISGHDPVDSTSVARGPIKYSGKDVKGLRIGFLSGFDSGDSVCPQAVADAFGAAGITFGNIRIPELKYALATYMILAYSEASGNMARFDGIKYGHAAQKFDNLNELYYNTRTEGFTLKTRERLGLGSLFLSSGMYDDYYDRAMKVRRLIVDAIMKSLGEFDALCMPVASVKSGNSPLQCDFANRYNTIASLAGLPSVVLPGMGVQLVGAEFTEDMLVSIASRVTPSDGGAK